MYKVVGLFGNSQQILSKKELKKRGLDAWWVKKSICQKDWMDYMQNIGFNNAW